MMKNLFGKNEKWKTGDVKLVAVLVMEEGAAIFKHYMVGTETEETYKNLNEESIRTSVKKLEHGKFSTLKEGEVAGFLIHGDDFFADQYRGSKTIDKEGINSILYKVENMSGSLLEEDKEWLGFEKEKSKVKRKIKI